MLTFRKLKDFFAIKQGTGISMDIFAMRKNSQKVISESTTHQKVDAIPTFSMSKQPTRSGVDCFFWERCKHFDEKHIAYCSTCQNNRTLKTESFYKPIKGLEP